MEDRFARLSPVDPPTLWRMLRYAVRSGADRLTLRPGFRPLMTGLGAPREVRHRPFTRDDTEAVAAELLERAFVPGRLREGPPGAARALPWWVELPGVALVGVRAAPARGGLALELELIRPLADPASEALLEA